MTSTHTVEAWGECTNKIQMNIPPDPKNLATALAKASFSKAQKRRILKSIKYLNQAKIKKLYDLLLELNKAEEEYANTVERIDLKYKMEFEKEFERNSKQ